MWKRYLRDFITIYPLWNYVPICKIIFNKSYSEFVNLNEILLKLIKRKMKNYNHSNHEISILSNLLKERKTLKKYRSISDELNDENLVRLIHDLFAGSIETSLNTFSWILIILKSSPRIEEKLRKEIINNIGERVPNILDKKSCHYVMAFLSEILRFKASLPVSIPHKTLEDYKFGMHYQIVNFSSIYEIILFCNYREHGGSQEFYLRVNYTCWVLQQCEL